MKWLGDLGNATALSPLSLAPGFSRVFVLRSGPAVLTAFETPCEKPLKRLSKPPVGCTRLKPGANERGAVSKAQVCESSRLRVIAAFLPLAFFLMVSTPAIAADSKDKKDEAKPEPPRIAITLPLAVSTGATNLIKIRGYHLTNITELRFTNSAVNCGISLKAKTKADVPKEADAKKVGDTQLEVELHFPADATTGTNWFVVVNSLGESKPQPLVVLPGGKLVTEKEPNGGFRQPQDVALGQTIAGLVKEVGDVDVFRFTGQRGQSIRAEVNAVRSGSALDALLTLYDDAGHILATSADTDGKTDPVLRAKLPADGKYFLSLIDAHDKSGPTHAYLLSIELNP